MLAKYAMFGPMIGLICGILTHRLGGTFAGYNGMLRRRQKGCMIAFRCCSRFSLRFLGFQLDVSESWSL